MMSRNGLTGHVSRNMVLIQSVIIPSCLLMQRDSIFCLVLCITVQGTKLITLSLEWNVSIGIYLQSITKNGFSCLQSVAELSYEGISSVN